MNRVPDATNKPDATTIDPELKPVWASVRGSVVVVVVWPPATVVVVVGAKVVVVLDVVVVDGVAGVELPS